MAEYGFTHPSGAGNGIPTRFLGLPGWGMGYRRVRVFLPADALPTPRHAVYLTTRNWLCDEEKVWRRPNAGVDRDFPGHDAFRVSRGVWGVARRVGSGRAQLGLRSARRVACY